MHNAHIEDNNIVFPARHGQDSDVFPMELLDTLSKLGRSVYRITDALHFYSIVRDAPEWRWAHPEELEGVDLTGWEVHYYESNWEDSCWNVVWLPKCIKVDNTYGDNDRYVAVHLDGEDESWGFYAGQELLLVKLSEENFAARCEEAKAIAIKDAIESAEFEAKYAAREAAEASRAFKPDPVGDVLKAWEAELLGINVDDVKEVNP